MANTISSYIDGLMTLKLHTHVDLITTQLSLAFSEGEVGIVVQCPLSTNMNIVIYCAYVLHIEFTCLRHLCTSCHTERKKISSIIDSRYFHCVFSKFELLKWGGERNNPTQTFTQHP